MPSIEPSRSDVWRRFHAKSEWKRRDAMVLLAGFVATFGLLAALSSVLPSALATPLVAAMMMLPGVYLAIYFCRSLGRAVAVDVDNQRVVVDGGRGGAFAFDRATLILWRMPEGRALQLSDGNATYRIGSMGHRLRVATPVTIVEEVDAEITQAEFEELLGFAGIEVSEAPIGYRVAGRPLGQRA